MNELQIQRFVAHVRTVAPWLTGGSWEDKRARIDVLVQGFGPDVTESDADASLKGLIRSGRGKDDITWPVVIDQALVVMRDRLARMPLARDPQELVPMPPDFHQRVAYWREQARAAAGRLYPGEPR